MELLEQRRRDFEVDGLAVIDGRVVIGLSKEEIVAAVAPGKIISQSFAWDANADLLCRTPL